MDTAQWPQIGVVKPMEEMATTTCSRPLMERRARPQKEQALNCPRCNSTNTKFCYYNNYSLTQPRYFCKTCRRYWTEGGSLRNVPVGGGSRKNKRSTSSSTSSSSSSASASSKKTSELNPPATTSLRSPSFQNTRIQQGQDLNLAFHTTHDYHNMPEYAELPNSNNSSNPATSSSLSALELLSGISSRGLSSFMQMPMQNPVASVYASGFGDLNDFKPSLNFPFDGIGGGVGVGYGNIQGVQEGGGRMLFPFEDLKPVSNTDFEQNRGQGDSPGYWNGMIGGGSW